MKILPELRLSGSALIAAFSMWSGTAAIADTGGRTPLPPATDPNGKVGWGKIQPVYSGGATATTHPTKYNIDNKKDSTGKLVWTAVGSAPVQLYSGTHIVQFWALKTTDKAPPPLPAPGAQPPPVDVKEKTLVKINVFYTAARSMGSGGKTVKPLQR